MNEVQKRELSVFKEIVIIINKHNLHYYAIGGTCIGAVRHKGFIPWDDDIDIAMPRSDYELLRTVYYKELPDYLRKLDGDNCQSHNYLFFKIHDSRCTYVEYNHAGSPDRYSGAFVDIMPVDGVPSKCFDDYYKTVNHYSHLNNINRPWPHEITSVKDAVKALGKKVIQLTHKYNYYSQKLTEYVKKYDYNSSEKVFFTWRFGDTLDRKLFDKSFFSDAKEVPFEDTTIIIPSKYDDYLTQDFGDYMKLPPEEEQHSIHSVYICDMDKPCELYAEMKRKGELK